MAVLVINVICFVVVAVSYIFINIKTLKTSKLLTAAAGPTAQMVHKRNQKLQRRVAMIITTDFLCWVPFVTICLLHFTEVTNATSMYGLFSIVVLPINSVINPFLYSTRIRTLVKQLTDKCLELYRGVRETDDDMVPGIVLELQNMPANTREQTATVNTRQTEIKADCGVRSCGQDNKDRITINADVICHRNDDE